MKIEDLNLKIGDKLPFNVIEDLQVYMRNEPNFYRKHLFPALLGVQETVQNGGKFNKRDMLPMLEKAIANYCKEYKINKRPQDLLTDAEKMECISTLLQSEAENFQKGFY
jgi:hypothetical protein